MKHNVQKLPKSSASVSAVSVDWETPTMSEALLEGPLWKNQLVFSNINRIHYKTFILQKLKWIINLIGK